MAYILLAVGYIFVGASLYGWAYSDEKNEDPDALFVSLVFWPLVIVLATGAYIGSKIKKRVKL